MLPFLYPVTLIVQHGSLLTTVAVALERYITTCHPHWWDWGLGGLGTRVWVLGQGLTIIHDNTTWIFRIIFHMWRYVPSYIGRAAIAFITLITFSLNINHFFELKTIEVPDVDDQGRNITKAVVATTDLRWPKRFFKFLNYQSIPLQSLKILQLHSNAKGCHSLQCPSHDVPHLFQYPDI